MKVGVLALLSELTIAPHMRYCGSNIFIDNRLVITKGTSCTLDFSEVSCRQRVKIAED